MNERSTNVDFVEGLLDGGNDDGNDDGKKVLRALVPAGDWFIVSLECGEQRFKGDLNVQRAYMERVIAWEHAELSNGVTTIEAFGHGGLIVEINTEEGEAYVSGDDRAPNGQLWRDVFDASESWTPGHYEIKDLSVFQLAKGDAAES